MLTVKVSFVGSGNSSTRRPLPSTYSEIPSTLVISLGAAGLAAGAAAGAGRAGAGGAACAEPSDPARPRPTTRAIATGVFTLVVISRHRRRAAGDRSPDWRIAAATNCDTVRGPDADAACGA